MKQKILVICASLKDIRLPRLASIFERVYEFLIMPEV